MTRAVAVVVVDVMGRMVDGARVCLSFADQQLWATTNAPDGYAVWGFVPEGIECFIQVWKDGYSYYNKPVPPMGGGTQTIRIGPSPSQPQDVQLPPLGFNRPPTPARWRGAFVIPGALPGQPAGYGDGERVWTPAYGTYPYDWRMRMLEVFTKRYPGGYFTINAASAQTYHDDYPALADDSERLNRDLTEIESFGLTPHVCATDDQQGGRVCDAFIHCGPKIRSAFPMWEMNGPLPMPAYDTATDQFYGPMVDCIRDTVNATHRGAQVLLHFTSGHGSIGIPERKGWEFCARNGVAGLMSQDNGYERAPDGDPVGTAAGLQDTAERLSTLGLINVGFEQTTTPVYHKWPDWDEDRARRYGDYLLEHAPGIVGVCDGSYV